MGSALRLASISPAWSMHALSSQHCGSRPSLFDSNSALNSSMRCHLRAGSSRQEWEMNASHSPMLALSVLANSPES
eukprot:scaffold116912_cov66-Phaeocystis_antarctica.AAC.1